MRILQKTLGVAALSLGTAFSAQAQDITVERLGDFPQELKRGILVKEAVGGVYGLTFEGRNTNGEDLDCVYIQESVAYQGIGGLSCNWFAPAGPGAPEQ